MIRLCLFSVLFFPLPGWAQKFSAADLRQLTIYSTGVFTNDMQMKADTHYIATSLKIQSIWPKRKDGVWLFAEKMDTSHNYEVWHFYLQDDTTLLLQFLHFKSAQQAEQLSRDIKQQSGLYLYNLVTSHGCDLYIKKNKTGYTATSEGKDCIAKKVGAEYTAYSIGFTKNSISWQENNFDKDDKESAGGVYNFIKKLTKTLK